MAIRPARRVTTIRPLLESPFVSEDTLLSRSLTFAFHVFSFAVMKRSLFVLRGSAVAFAFACALLLAWDLRGALIAAESFAYNTPTIRGCNGGDGWADAWTGDNLIMPGSLNFTGHATRGNQLTTLGDSMGKSDAVKCSFRTLATTGRDDLLIDGKFGRPDTTIWFSFLANMPEGANARTGIFAGVSLLDDQRERMFFGRTSKRNAWAFERSGQTQQFSTNRADVNVALLVYKMTFRTTDARVEMWVNPGPGTNDLSTVPVATANVREFRFNRVRICSAPGTFGIDELRFGTTYADIARLP